MADAGRNNEIIGWLMVILMLACIAALTWQPRPKVVRYRCIITREAEILCFQPDDGRMFRPERRFNEFVLEVPK